MKSPSAAVTLGILAAVAVACDNVPRELEPSAGTHPDGFGDPTAHGPVAETDMGSCTICHGEDFAGGSRAPSCNECHGSAGWREDCTFCHGAPPAGHAAGDCGTCHSGYTGSSVNASLHMNGRVDATGGHAAGWAASDQHGYGANRSGLASCRACHGADLAGGTSGVSCASCHGAGWSSNCTFCHGTAGLRASPPVDREGRTARSNVSVGAHEAHATSGLSSPVACATCHPDRGDVVSDTAHVDGGAAEVALAGVASGGTYVRSSGTAATCTAWCHGSFPGGRNTTAQWTSTAAMTCDTCHRQAPTTGRHPAVFGDHSGYGCSTCHGTGYSSTAVTGAAVATHVNGSIERAASLNWQTSPRKSCDPSCHGREDW